MEKTNNGGFYRWKVNIWGIPTDQSCKYRAEGYFDNPADIWRYIEKGWEAVGEESILGVCFCNYWRAIFTKKSYPKIRQWIEETMKTPPLIDKQPLP